MVRPIVKADSFLCTVVNIKNYRVVRIALISHKYIGEQQTSTHVRQLTFACAFGCKHPVRQEKLTTKTSQLPACLLLRSTITIFIRF